MSFGDRIETRSEFEAAELDRENRVADRLATNAPELDWIAATEIQRKAEESEREVLTAAAERWTEVKEMLS